MLTNKVIRPSFKKKLRRIWNTSGNKNAVAELTINELNGYAVDNPLHGIVYPLQSERGTVVCAKIGMLLERSATSEIFLRDLLEFLGRTNLW